MMSQLNKTDLINAKMPSKSKFVIKLKMRRGLLYTIFYQNLLFCKSEKIIMMTEN